MASKGQVFKRLGKNVTIFPRAEFARSESITILDDTQIADFVFINGGQETTIENNVHIATHVSIYGGGILRMRAFSGLSSGCRVITGTDDFTGPYMSNPTVPKELRNPTVGKVEIGRHALLGANVTVLPNVSIGEGAVIAAGSLVRRDVAPWSIWVEKAPTKLVKIGERDKIAILRLEHRYYVEFLDEERRQLHLPRIDEIKRLIDV